MDIKGIVYRIIRDIFRIGKVSSVNGKNCTVRVTFPDKDNVVSDELPIIVIGSYKTKGYWVPEVNMQVLCCFLPIISGVGLNKGFVLGGFYSTEDPPEETDPKVRCLKVPDGSYIRFDGNGEVHIHASSHMILTAPKIDLNP